MIEYWKRRAIITFCVLLFFSGIACAVELPSINKSKIRLSIAPGQSGYGEITIENTSKETRKIQAYLEDWYYLPAADGTKAFVSLGTTPLSCARWISFSPQEFTLAPFSKQKLNYSIKVPADACGGYYAVLFFESIFGKLETQEKDLRAGVDIAIRIATLFYVEVEGAVNRSADIENLQVNSVAGQPLSVQLDFRNSGNVDITCGGKFHVMDKQGMVYSRGEFKDIYTFPGDSAKLSAISKEKIPPGEYDLIMTLDLGKASEEAELSRGPIITKEAEIKIGPENKILRVGELR